MSYHSEETLLSIHVLCNWNYANEAARTGASGFTASDVGKAAWQTDNNTFWVLVATTPTWVQLGASGATDHGSLTGLGDDDHSQYHNDTRGDARYRTQSELSSTTASSEGAALVGTDAKVNLDNSDTVEECLTYINEHFKGLDPETHYKFEDDFTGVSFRRPWTEQGDVGGDATILAGEINGIAQIESNGVTDDFYELSTVKEHVAVANNPVWLSRMKLEQTSDISVYHGWRDGTTNLIEFKANSATGYWDCRCRSGGTTTTTATTVALDTDWHWLKIVATSSSVSFYIDGVSVVTPITTNIPSAVMDITMQTYTTGGTTARSHLVDYVKTVADR